MVWYGLVWFGMVWHGSSWFGIVWHGLVYLEILKIADICYFYILITDGQTDGQTDRRTLVLVKSLSRLISLEYQVSLANLR